MREIYIYTHYIIYILSITSVSVVRDDRMFEPETCI